MKNIREYLKSVRFSLGYAFRFVPKETVAMMLIVIVAGALPYGSSWFLGKLVNAIVAGAKIASYENIWLLLFLYATVNALPSILGNIRLFINRHWQLKLSHEVEMDMFVHRERIDIATYEDPKFQDLLQRAFRKGPYIAFELASAQFDLVQEIATLIIGTGLAVHFNPMIYFIVIASAFPSFIIDTKYATRGWSIWTKDSPEQRRFSDLRQHIMNRTPLIETKLLQSGNKLIGWMRKIMSDFMYKQLQLEKSRVWQTTVADLLAYIGFGAALFLLVRQIISGDLEVGSLVYMMGTLATVRSSITRIMSSLGRQYETHLIVKDVEEVVETKSVILDVKNPTYLNLSSAPEIVFENVSFKYPNNDVWSLRKLSMKLVPGSKIGLVGNNGAGKTTFVKLLCRIYDPTEGRILVNGVDLRDISTKEWWSYLGIMFQDYASYDFAVKEAIAIGRPGTGLKLDKVVEAAETAQAHEFIEEWKDGYNQQLGVEFGGKEPSKGQRQKLSIAKIIYRNALVMILDEPTASVDAESEAKIFDSLEGFSKNTTALLISHDFSTILQCNQIFVFEKGMLIEDGTHAELLKKKGVYAHLYELQAERFR
ncbi:MAG: ABC transporter ATP-binding protein [Candidatus Zambryskibacteria bacterium]|nr:ABC transporter ATP-binding protein [Candidatus Zambryskibacteria bacterium]